MVKPLFHWVIVGTLVSVAGCGDRTPPVISDLTFTTNPSGRAPLVAQATLTTDEVAQVSVEMAAGEHTWVHAPASAHHVEHSVMVLGLQPERAYQIVIVATDAAGNEVRSSAYEITTPALPDDFPPITATRSEPDRMEPGVDLIQCVPAGRGRPGQ